MKATYEQRTTDRGLVIDKLTFLTIEAAKEHGRQLIINDCHILEIVIRVNGNIITLASSERLKEYRREENDLGIL